jgi:6,7-dimethyl-8-ribityllumazine synthase
MAVKELSGDLQAGGLKIGIAISRFNSFLTKELLGGALDCLLRHGAAEKDLTVVWVPGANELPSAVQQMAQTGTYHAIVAVGAVVQGATAHADLINTQVSRSLAQLSSTHNLPVINGVVCAQNLEQAIERSGTKAGNKGWSAAIAAIEMANLFAKLHAKA